MAKITSNKYFHIITSSFLIILSFCLNISISLSQIALGVLLLCLIIYIVDNRYNIIRKDIYFTLFTFYWLSAILSTFLGSEYAALGKGLTSPWPMLIFFASIYFIDKKYLPYIVLAFAAGLFLTTLSGYYYYIRFGEIDYRYFRSHSLAGGYMMTAHLLSIGIIFLASIILSKLERNKYIIIFYIIVMLTSLHVLLITATRMPLIAVIAVISLMLVVKLRWKGVIAAFLILLSAFIYVITDDYMLARFDNFFASFNEPLSSNGWRLLLWKNGIEVFKEYPLFGIGVNAYEAFKTQNDALYKVGQKAQFSGSLTNPITRLVNNSTYAIVGMVAAILCALSFKDNNMILGASCTVGTILTFIQFSNQFAKPFNEISSCVPEIQTGFSSLKRINNVLNESNDVNDGKEKINEVIKKIEFNHVDFGYSKDKLVIKDFNIEVKEGQKIAIVGPTGCGKTTIINLLLRFYDPSQGSISFDNLNTKDILKESLRNSFGMVLQDTWIFSGTVRENIIYGKKDASEEEIIEATKKANCYDFIMRLPNGFDTYIDDYSGLSVGQKQLISIARVMLVNPKIMILDEATSNIDTRTEMKISAAFNILMEGKTSFVIAHRLSTIIHSDLILVMKDGEIIEQGKHDELLAKHGFYYDLYNAQYSKIN